MKNGKVKFKGTPPPKKRYIQHFLSKLKKIKVVQNCVKWQENWSKIFFELYSPPSKTKKNFAGRTNFLVKTEKNQSCSKLHEMARKLVENEFWTF